MSTEYQCSKSKCLKEKGIKLKKYEIPETKVRVWKLFWKSKENLDIFIRPSIFATIDTNIMCVGQELKEINYIESIRINISG